MLKIENIDCFYGDFQVLRDVSMNVPEGKIVALLGPNAAGKTTTLAAISRLLRYSRGRIIFNGQELSDAKAEKVVDMGIAHVPEGRKLFQTLTVKENLEMGAYVKRARSHVDQTLKQVYDLFPVLKDRSKQLAGSLSGGEQQMCAIARGLMAKPSLLMIDEMSLGLSPLLAKQMFEMVRQIVEIGITLLLVEQQVNHTLKIAHTVYIMEKGNIVMSGPAAEIAGNEHVRKSYLGM
ncbi:MAG: ABC transporter ATP-binding protein [Desulfovermiculus sp.]|nr:ABC transporter ATP-binding protein [Desulfovermiculus sp.]